MWKLDFEKFALSVSKLTTTRALLEQKTSLQGGVLGSWGEKRKFTVSLG